MIEPNFDEIDLTLAIQLQAQFEEELRVERKKKEEKLKYLQVTDHVWKSKGKDLTEPQQEKLSVSLVDPCWELLDPNPNIYDLFLTFNHQFFWGRLMGVEVKWSSRMTLCAGVCSYEGRGGLCSVRLSMPLLKLRPRKDLIETLLHEMIHAYLFVTHRNMDHDAHGPQFQRHMHRINDLAGTKISVYHSFHDEVAVYRQHVWRCNGPCRTRPPYFGLVKRSMNRPPSPRDPWWGQHAHSCGGTYSKIKEPDGYGIKKNKKIEDKSSKDIRSFFPIIGNKRPKMTDDIQNRSNLESFKKVNRFHSSDAGSKGSETGVSIQNASSANVYGLGKPATTGGTTSWGTRITSKNAATTTTIGSSSVGSKTIVVKKKNTTEVPKGRSDAVRSSFVVFSGNGHSLGGSSSTSQTGKSRLLSQFEPCKWKQKEGARSVSQVDSSVTTGVVNDSTSNDVINDDESTAAAFSDDQTMCPMCQVQINSNQFEKHVEICFGDFDVSDDFALEESGYFSIPESRDTIKKNYPNQGTSNDVRDNLDVCTRVYDTSNSSRPTGQTKSSLTTQCKDKSVIDLVEGRTTLSDDEVTMVENTSPPNRVAFDTTTSVANHKSFNHENYHPCPVCDKTFPQSEINGHVNGHFN